MEKYYTVMYLKKPIRVEMLFYLQFFSHCRESQSAINSNTQSAINSNIDLAMHFDDLGHEESSDAPVRSRITNEISSFLYYAASNETFLNDAFRIQSEKIRCGVKDIFYDRIRDSFLFFRRTADSYVQFMTPDLKFDYEYKHELKYFELPNNHCMEKFLDFMFLFGPFNVHIENSDSDPSESVRDLFRTGKRHKQNRALIKNFLNSPKISHQTLQFICEIVSKEKHIYFESVLYDGSKRIDLNRECEKFVFFNTKACSAKKQRCLISLHPDAEKILFDTNTSILRLDSSKMVRVIDLNLNAPDERLFAQMMSCCICLRRLSITCQRLRKDFRFLINMNFLMLDSLTVRIQTPVDKKHILKMRNFLTSIRDLDLDITPLERGYGQKLEAFNERMQEIPLKSNENSAGNRYFENIRTHDAGSISYDYLPSSVGTEDCQDDNEIDVNSDIRWDLPLDLRTQRSDQNEEKNINSSTEKVRRKKDVEKECTQNDYPQQFLYTQDVFSGQPSTSFSSNFSLDNFQYEEIREASDPNSSQQIIENPEIDTSTGVYVSGQGTIRKLLMDLDSPMHQKESDQTFEFPVSEKKIYKIPKESMRMCTGSTKRKSHLLTSIEQKNKISLNPELDLLAEPGEVLETRKKSFCVGDHHDSSNSSRYVQATQNEISPGKKLSLPSSPNHSILRLAVESKSPVKEHHSLCERIATTSLNINQPEILASHNQTHAFSNLEYSSPSNPNVFLRSQSIDSSYKESGFDDEDI